MRIKGKNNAALAGMSRLERHGRENHGDKFNFWVHQWVGCARLAIEHEARHYLDKTIWPYLERELRHALSAKDGTFFRALADNFDARGQRPVDPLREWADRTLFKTVDGPKGEHQPHEGKTFNELLNMFYAEYPKGTKMLADGRIVPDSKVRPDPDVARRQLAALGVRWKKDRPGKRSANRRQ